MKSDTWKKRVKIPNNQLGSQGQLNMNISMEFRKWKLKFSLTNVKITGPQC